MQVRLKNNRILITIKTTTMENGIETQNDQELMNAKDWGRLYYQKDILKAIEEKQNALNDQDAAGHIYWNQFKELVESIKP